jgi:hypothetical protein
MREPDDLAVLLVHGIGAQRRGDTLLDFGEPLVESLTDWLGADAVEVSRTELVQPSAACPAHLHLTVRRGGERKRVLVAESWWADTFNPPGWLPFVKWLVGAVPSVVARAADHGISVIDTNDKLDQARAAHSPALLWHIAVRLAKNALSVAFVLLVMLWLLVLGVVALVPRVRVALLSTQRLLIRYIGDSYYLLRSPLRADATVSQVERDLAWLERESSAKLAILAHSQGAELAYRVLTRRASARPIASLITFGSGIAKLRAVDRLAVHKARALLAFALRIAAAAMTVGAPLLAARDGWSTTTTVVVAAALVVAGLLLTQARRLLKGVVQSERLADELAERIGPDKVERWLDFYATSDPVPEGPLPLQTLMPKLDAAASTRIANRRSILRDHISYAHNGEAFRPGVLAELAGLVGWTLTKPSMAVVQNARTRRERLTWLLVAWRLVIAGLAAAAIVLPVLDAYGRDAANDVSRWLEKPTGWVADLFDVRNWVTGHPRDDVIAAAVLALVAFVVYRISAAPWDWRARERARLLFQPARPPVAGAVGSPVPLLLRPLQSLAVRYAVRVERTGGWESRPRLRGGVALYGLRHQLRQFNLYDTPAVDPPKRTMYSARVKARTLRGNDTDLTDRDMGAAGTHFGRNGPGFPPPRDLPAPPRVADELLARPEGGFVPAKSLNLLAAAWVQFEVHDWMQHQVQSRWKPDADGVRGPLLDGTEPFAQVAGSAPGSPRFLSDQTHWWDASQLYGVDARFVDRIRTDGGRVKVGNELLLAIEASSGDTPMPVPNFWLGLAVFHDLFAHEHNRICDVLEASESLKGDALFEKARLVNAALMAKIHTVEWTPAVIAHPTTEHAIRATWWGVLGEPVRKRLGRIGPGEVLSGIPGSRTHHDGVRYSLTEEFVAVYRMHPLIPDAVTFRRAGTGKDAAELDGGAKVEFARLAAGGHPDAPRTMLNAVGWDDSVFSLANAYPGAISLRNFPRALRELPQQPREDRTPRGLLDLAARDIERSRETALPLYNDFRKVFRLPPKETFIELADHDNELASAIKDVYEKVDDVDVMVGLFAERKPEGFAFSDTAFRVFLLMAARRLRSDRLLTSDFTPEVYTPTGYRWVQDRTTTEMLWERYAGLRPALAGVENVFKPWNAAIADRG